MKTNPKQAANGRSRPAANGRRAPLARGGGPTNSVKNRIGKPTVKPTGDLRQMLAKKVAKSSPNKPAEKTPASNVKSRLGLQSHTARLEAQREAKAQMQAIRDKNKPKPDVKAAPTPSQTKSTVQARRPDSRTPLRQSTASIPASRDNRNAAVASRRPLERSAFKADYRSRNERINRGPAIKSVTTQPIIIPQIIPAAQPAVVYQQSAYEPPSRYLSRQPEVVTTSMTGGTSVLVSNLSPKITEDEVAELFGDIGPLVNIQMINSTTALITYHAAQHSIRAVKVYNCRLLDGIPMNCTILPTTTATSPQASSSQQPLYSGGRMYSDSIHSGVPRRPNYHLTI